MILYIFVLTVFSTNLFAFDGVITYTQTDLENGKQVPSITKELNAYFKDDELVRINLKFDKSKYKVATQDVYISHSKGVVTNVSVDDRKYSKSSFDKLIKPKVMPSAQAEIKTFYNQKTRTYLFPEDHSKVKTSLYYSESFKVKPQPYLSSAIGSMSWALNPETGAVAMKIHMQLTKDTERIMEVSKIDARELKPAEYIPRLERYELEK